MRLIRRALPLAAMLAFAAPAAATTVNATVTGFLDSSFGVNRIVVSPASNLTVFASRMTVQGNSATAPYTLLGGTTPGSFVAFCIEPLELVGEGTAVDYQIVPLSEAASGLGGIGATKASRIQELFGRFAPNTGYGTMTGATSVALQLAIWEIVMETPGNALVLGDRALNRGNFYVRSTVGASSAISAATTMLNALNGTGPMADGLFALRNGTVGEQGSGSQDLLVFATVAAPPAVPEPASWAMLIAGFGLVGASLRRRRVAAAG